MATRTTMLHQIHRRSNQGRPAHISTVLHSEDPLEQGAWRAENGTSWTEKDNYEDKPT